MAGGAEGGEGEKGKGREEGVVGEGKKYLVMVQVGYFSFFLLSFFPSFLLSFSPSSLLSIFLSSL